MVLVTKVEAGALPPDTIISSYETNGKFLRGIQSRHNKEDTVSTISLNLVVSHFPIAWILYFTVTPIIDYKTIETFALLTDRVSSSTLG